MANQDKVKISRRFINLIWEFSADCLRAQDIPFDISSDIRTRILENSANFLSLSGEVSADQQNLADFLTWFNNDYDPQVFKLSGTTHLSGDVLPEIDNDVNLGSNLRHFKELYIKDYTLTDRLNYLSGLININQQNISQNASDISQLQTNVQYLSSEIDNNSNEISGLDVRVTNLEDEIDNYIPLSGTDKISGNLLPKDNETYNIGSNLYRFNDYFIGYYGSVKDTLSGIKQDISDLQNQGSSADTRIDDLSAQVQQIEGRVDGHDTDITYLSGKIDENSGNILTLSSQVQINTNDIQTNQNDISNLQADVNNLSGQVQTNTTNIQTNANDIALLDTRVSNNETNISSNINNINYNHSLILQNSADIITNRNNIETLSANQGEVTGAFLADGSRMMSGDVIPYQDNIYSLGLSGYSFRDLYLRDGTIGSVVDYLQMLYNLPRYELSAYKQIINNSTEYSGNYLIFDSTYFDILTGNYGSSGDTSLQINFNGAILNNYYGFAYVSDNLLNDPFDYDSLYSPDQYNYQGSYINESEILSGDDVDVIGVFQNYYIDYDLFLQTITVLSGENSGRIFQRTITYDSSDLYNPLSSEIRDIKNEKIKNLSGNSYDLRYIDAGQIYVNDDTTTSSNYNLPLLNKEELNGLKFQFANVVSTQIQVNAGSSDIIQVGNIKSTSGGYISTSAEGAFLKLIGIKPGLWLGIPEYETWTIQ